MKYRSSLLHTCWCIVFECLNSNLYLNSFGWLFFKNRKPFSFILLSYTHFWSVFVLAQFHRRPQAPPQFLAQRAASPAARPSAAQHRGRPAAATGGAPPVIPDLGSETDWGQGPDPEPAARACGRRPARLGRCPAYLKVANAVPCRLRPKP
jgi:hypothetical protein